MGRRANLGLAAALFAPWLVNAIPTHIEKRAPLLPVAGDDPLLPSPTAFSPDVPTPLSERDLTTDTDMYEFKRSPSLAMREAADAHLETLRERLRKKRELGEPDFVAPEQHIVLEARAARKKITCLASNSTQDDITNAFLAGGAGTRVALCPSTTYTLTDVVYFTASNQELYTLGYPLDDTRAVLSVTGASQSVAIYGGCGDCDAIAIRNIQVNGNRPSLGRIGDGAGLLEMGGSNKDQVVSACHLYDPRGWSAFHIAEGYQNSCTSTNILNNQIGPAGNSPNSAYQFNRVMAAYAKIRSNPKALRKRGVVAPGQWADGISLACANSVVRGNTITDATDGAIVLFGSPGSTVSSNTIISDTQVALGGINMVDKWPWGGSFDDVMVKSNTLITKNSMIKVGIAMGPMVWGTYNESDGRTWGGNVRSNSFTSVNGYFGFGIATAGHFGAVISGNKFTGARFNYATSYACFPQWMPPAAGSLVRDPSNTNGTFQTGTVSGNIVLPICIMPCEYTDAGCTWAAAAKTSSKTSTSPTSSAALQVVSNKKNSGAADDSDKAASSSKTTVKASATAKQNKVSTNAAAEGEWTRVNKMVAVEDFVDDRPPYTYASNDGLHKAESDDTYVLPDAPFQVARVKRNDLNESDVLLPGFGRNVYEQEALVEGSFLAPLNS